jgi:hypothetical protein
MACAESAAGLGVLEDMTRALCGARARSGKPCRRPAGWGTEHAGYGACKLHGGSTPNAARRPPNSKPPIRRCGSAKYLVYLPKSAAGLGVLEDGEATARLGRDVRGDLLQDACTRLYR